MSWSTPAISSISLVGRREMSPYTPISVISSPIIFPTLKPRSTMRCSTASISSRLASRRILTSMWSSQPLSRRLYGRDGHAIEPEAMRQGAARECVLALDVGTTGVRALVVNEAGTVVGEAYREALPHAPRPGLLEHDLDVLLAAVTGVLGAATAGVPAGAIRGFGLAAQRATAVVWETATGRPVHPAISWQDQRAAARCARLLEEGVFVSPLTAATKLEWILDRVDADRRRVEAGKLRCGTLDAWLVTRLLGEGTFVTDGSHASCSGLYDFATTGWSETIAAALRIPLAAVPTIVDSSGVLGRIAPTFAAADAPFAAIIGDQQGAMMGQLRLDPGEIKITYGTAAMLDLNAGTTPLFSVSGAYPLVLWRRDGAPTYCLEGTAITAGAAITWLRDGLGVVAEPADCDRLASSVPDSGGVWAIPALQGLGTPYMDAGARAAVGGISRGTTRAHVVRAVLEGIAWPCREVYDALRENCPYAPPATLRADGGAARSDVLLQAQADALGIPVERATVLQASGLGAAYLAGIATGVWQNPRELAGTWKRDRLFEPRIDRTEREGRFAAWRRHLEVVRSHG